MRRLFLGFIQIHILYRASQRPVYGTLLLEELQNRGCFLSPGLLYPVLHALERENLLLREDRTVNGRLRKYYSTTQKGSVILQQAKQMAVELVEELKAGEQNLQQ